MNIQTRKMNLIEEFLRISDERIISKLEIFMNKEGKKAYAKELKPMSLENFYDMIEQAKRESEEGLTISHSELKKKVKTWE